MDWLKEINQIKLKLSAISCNLKCYAEGFGVTGNELMRANLWREAARVEEVENEIEEAINSKLDFDLKEAQAQAGKVLKALVEKSFKKG